MSYLDGRLLSLKLHVINLNNWTTLRLLMFSLRNDIYNHRNHAMLDTALSKRNIFRSRADRRTCALGYSAYRIGYRRQALVPDLKYHTWLATLFVESDVLIGVKCCYAIYIIIITMPELRTIRKATRAMLSKIQHLPKANVSREQASCKSERYSAREWTVC